MSEPKKQLEPKLVNVDVRHDKYQLYDLLFVWVISSTWPPKQNF